jgi:hypothetical protein
VYISAANGATHVVFSCGDYKCVVLGKPHALVQ